MVTLGKFSEIASFDVDCQKTFTGICPDELPVPEGELIVDELNAQAKWAKFRVGSKEAHSPYAIWIADEKHPQLTPIHGDNVDFYWKPHSIPGTLGFELIKGLPPVTHYDFFVWKGVELDMHPYGSCFHDMAEKMSTGVIEFLKQHQVKIVIIGGLATDYCVKVTALQLQRRGFKTILNLGACRGIAKETTDNAIAEMKEAGISMIDNVSDLKGDL